MRNAAFVFSWLFFMLHLLMLASIGIFCVTLIFSKDSLPGLAVALLFYFLPMLLLGGVHHLASRLIVPRPLTAALVEFGPALFFIGLSFWDRTPVFLVMATPHLLVGSLSWFSADQKIGELVAAD